MNLSENTDLILDVILKRRSGVAFKEDPIPENILISILEAGRRAPSCANTQAWNFVVLRDHEVLVRAHEALSKGNVWGKRAPVMILVAAKEDGGCGAHGLPYFTMDVGLAVENMLLQAVHMGLVGHPTAGWNENMLKDIAGIPEDYRIVTVIFFGYKGNIKDLDERTKEKELKSFSRRPLSEIVHFEKWGGSGTWF